MGSCAELNHITEDMALPFQLKLFFHRLLFCMQPCLVYLLQPSMSLLNKHKQLTSNSELYQAKILEYVNTCQQQQALPTRLNIAVYVLMYYNLSPTKTVFLLNPQRLPRQTQSRDCIESRVRVTEL